MEEGYHICIFLKSQSICDEACLHSCKSVFACDKVIVGTPNNHSQLREGNRTFSKVFGQNGMNLISGRCTKSMFLIFHGDVRV